MLQVERVGRILNVTLLADRILLCCILVNVVRLLALWVKRAPEIIDRVPFQMLMERPHGTRIILRGASAVKEISDCEAFYAKFGHSFEAIKVILSGTLQLFNKTLCCLVRCRHCLVRCRHCNQAKKISSFVAYG